MNSENKEILNFFSRFVSDKGVLTIPEEIFLKMTVEHGMILREGFSSPSLFHLPLYEIRFHEWLKENDPAVWDDLWKSDNLEEGLYDVSLAFMPLVLEKDGRGFPICDLVDNDNYYFTMRHFPDQESRIFVESARERFRAKEPLTVAQLLCVEISVGAIDIWHFAYKHKVALADAKKAVKQLTDDNILVHLKDAGHLANFVEI